MCVQAVVATCYECQDIHVELLGTRYGTQENKHTHATFSTQVYDCVSTHYRQCTSLYACKISGLHSSHQFANTYSLSYVRLENNVHMYSAIILTSTTHMGSLTHELTDT